LFSSYGIATFDYQKPINFYQMKKLQLMFVAIAAIAMVGFASCAPKAKEAAKETTGAVIVQDSTVAVQDSAAVAAPDSAAMAK
jgi:hypothetical protein